MRRVVVLLAVVGIMGFSACEPKKMESTATLEEASDATDIAETTAAPLDTLTTAGDSVEVQK
ncbi:hypothetical protein [Rufibacter sp. LB8]|uniref:hypothetical protein n=1 Tax=Rufibacter sp. LB8 TaxID=2777781 RepID=UPI00178C4DDA|nr:hypothetical protein [Rufibacter sp. LB8]